MRKLLLLPVAVVALAVSACQGTTERVATHQAALQGQADAAALAFETQRGHRGPDNVRYHDELWLGEQGVRVDQGVPLPDALEADDGVTLVTTDPLTLTQIVGRLKALTGLHFSGHNEIGGDTPRNADGAAPGGDPSNQRLAVNYTGPLSGLLDEIANHYNINWRYEAGAIRLFTVETKVFNLVIPVTDMRVMAGVESTINGAQSDTGQNESQLGVEAQALLQFWQQIEEDLEGFLPNQASYSLAPELGTITVTARPGTLARVERFVRDTNKRMSRQVAIAVKVLTVNLEETEGFNVDLQFVMRDVLSPDVVLSSVAPNVLTAASASSVGIVDPVSAGGNWKKFVGSEAIVEALIENRAATLETSSAVVAMNNTAAPVQVANQRAYVDGYDISQGSSGNVITPTTSVLTTGFSMTVLPRITPDNHVALSYTLGLSELTQMRSFGEDNPVEMPEVATSGLIQSVLMRSGDTLILGGFERVSSSRGTAQDGIFHLLTGGNRSASSSREMVIILMTPVIIERPDAIPALR